MTKQKQKPWVKFGKNVFLNSTKINQICSNKLGHIVFNKNNINLLNNWAYPIFNRSVVNKTVIKVETQTQNNFPTWKIPFQHRV